MANAFQDGFVALLLTTGMAVSVLMKKLTLAAALGGGVIGLFVYMGAHLTGLGMLIIFFILATAATGWHKNKKRKLEGFTNDTSQRNLSQVLANGGMAAVCGIGAAVFPAEKDFFILMMAGALSTATADTLSSELGTLYGKRFINIVTLRPDIRGMDGVVSLEGLLIGIAGSFFIAAVFSLGYNSNSYFLPLIIIAGTIGNLSDSLLGALFERKKLVNNDTVNLIATAVGALVTRVF